MLTGHRTRTGHAIGDATAHVPMDRLPQGSSGRITEIDVAKADLARLEVMGICPGRLVHIIQQGDPLIVRVLDTRIGLAAVLATFVYVAPANVL